MVRQIGFGKYSPQIPGIYIRGRGVVDFGGGGALSN